MTANPSGQGLPDIQAFFARFRKETDRACGVLGAALLDTMLERLLLHHLAQTPGSQQLVTKGALRGFYARIELAHALGLCDDDTRHDLEAIRQVRNHFAHAIDHELSFASPLIRDLAVALRSTEAYLSGFDAMAAGNPQMSRSLFDGMRATQSTPRARFELAVGFIGAIIDEQIDRAVVPSYSGTALVAHARDSSARARFKVSITATVTPPVKPG